VRAPHILDMQLIFNFVGFLSVSVYKNCTWNDTEYRQKFIEVVSIQEKYKEIKEKQAEHVSHMWGRQEMRAEFWGRKLKEKDHLEERDVDGIILE